MRVVYDFPLREDDGVLGHCVPVLRREVKACSVVNIISRVVPIRNSAKFAAIRGVLPTRNLVSEPEFASVSVKLQHPVALARPGHRLYSLRVQRADAIIEVAVPRGVSVHATLTLCDLIARVAARRDVRIHV